MLPFVVEIDNSAPTFASSDALIVTSASDAIVTFPTCVSPIFASPSKTIVNSSPDLLLIDIVSFPTSFTVKTLLDDAIERVASKAAVE